jgi:hypothetical protein
MGDLMLPGSDDPDLARLGQAFRDELRAEAEAYEALAAKDGLRRRDLAAVAVELVHRGDVVRAETGSAAFTGVVVDAEGDRATLRTAAGDVVLRTSAPIALRVVERRRAGGSACERRGGSFLACLRALEGQSVELGCPGLGVDLVGMLEAVGVDHLVIAAGGERSFVALSALVWVRPLPR